jgi:hypothetical protein
MYPIGYVYFKNHNQLFKLVVCIFIAGIIFVAEHLLANYYGIGSVDYEGLSIYVGELSRVNSHIAALCCLLTPLIFLMEKKKKTKKMTLMIISFLCLFTLILIMRRAPIASIFIGYATISIYFVLKSNIKQKKFSLLIILFMFVAVYSSYPYINERLEQRNRPLNAPILELIERELRTKEIYETTNRIISFDNTAFSLFGEEIFSIDYHRGRYVSYGLFSNIYLDRSLHTSYARIISGSGIIGMILFFIVMSKIYLIYYRSTKKIKHYSIKLILACGVFNALFLVSLFNLYTSAYFHLTYLPFLFLCLGALTGVISNHNKNNICFIKT